jgi:hypothetical protein
MWLLGNLRVELMDSDFKEYASKVIADAATTAERLEHPDVISKINLVYESLDDRVWNNVEKITPAFPNAGLAYMLHSILQSIPKAVNHHTERTYTNETAEAWRKEVLDRLKELQFLFARQPHQFKNIDELIRRREIDRILPMMEGEHLSTKGTLWPMAFSGLSAFNSLKGISLATAADQINQTTIPDRPGVQKGLQSLVDIKTIRRRYCLEMCAYFPIEIALRNKIIARFANLLFLDPEGTELRASQVARLKGEEFSEWRIAEFDAMASVTKLDAALGLSLTKAKQALIFSLVGSCK